MDKTICCNAPFVMKACKRVCSACGKPAGVRRES